MQTFSRDRYNTVYNCMFNQNDLFTPVGGICNRFSTHPSRVRTINCSVDRYRCEKPNFDSKRLLENKHHRKKRSIIDRDKVDALTDERGAVK